MSPVEVAYIQSLTALANSAQRLATAVEAGDWDAVSREIPENTACFARLREISVDVPTKLERSQQAQVAQLISKIIAANEGTAGKVSPRLADMRPLLATLSA